ncbi:saccharopine dehydrogenase family protein [Amnibacterium endophyticum]|uniref:Saccharopine dehydrogenase family protein n=1 Tax=Amnibacterium endophyticum TaxID=2109337 RepID=A0ABW4LGQ9_9MICO
MRILIVGAGGAGDAIAKIVATRTFAEAVVLVDPDAARAERTLGWIADRHGADIAGRYTAAAVDPADPDAVTRVARANRVTHVVNAVEPRLVPSVFAGALAAGADYLDLTMSPSEPHPTEPHRLVGVKPGDDQFAQAGDWEASGRLALVGMAAQPGLSDVFARYAADHLFSQVDELGVRDGANLTVRDERGEPVPVPFLRLRSALDECLTPPVVWQREGGWSAAPPLGETEVFHFPAGIGAVECLPVEQGEVVLMPRRLDAQRVTVKRGLGRDLVGALRTLDALGLASQVPVRLSGAAGPVEVAPRAVVAAALPDPATIWPRVEGRTCAGLQVTGTGTDGAPRSTLLFHIADNAETMREFDSPCTVWQSALPAVVALELLATGAWTGVGVLGPEAFDALPFLELMARPTALGGYGQSWGTEDRPTVG